MKRYAFMLMVGGFLFAAPAWAALYDLRITPENIVLDPPNPLARQLVRIYATVENIGERDTEGSIEFYDGDRKIGSKVLSVRANSRPDEVWIPWTPESEGGHTLRVRLISDSDTPDENPGNGSVSLDVYADRDTDGDGFGDRIDQDDDNDGATDSADQFPQDARRQKDTDNDGVEDKDDQDRDNDGLSNEEEARLGTDPLKRDTDGDGVGDKEDAFPLDPTKSKKDLPKPPTPPPTPAVQKPPSTPSPTPKLPTSPPTTAIAPVGSEPSVQPVTTSVLEQIGNPVPPTEPTAAIKEEGREKRESDTVALEAAKDQESSQTIPVLTGLAIVSALVGGWFLFKSRDA